MGLKTANVVIVGSLNMDLVVHAPRLPVPGETILGGEFHTLAGGKGANQAVAAARLGAKTAIIGRVGTDDYGRTLLQALADSEVAYTAVTQDKTAPTGIAIIVVGADGQNSIVVASGANKHFSIEDVLQASDLIADADVLLLQLEIPLDTVTCAAQIARENNVQVILNPAPAQTLPLDLLVLVDFLIPNETEAALLADLPVSTREEALTAAKKLAKTISGTVILTLGEHGALYVENGRSIHNPAFNVQPIDATAAGDAFVAGLAVALAEGKPIDKAIRQANAAGALATTTLGAQPSLPFRKQVEQLIAANK